MNVWTELYKNKIREIRRFLGVKNIENRAPTKKSDICIKQDKYALGTYIDETV